MHNVQVFMRDLNQNLETRDSSNLHRIVKSRLVVQRLWSLSTRLKFYSSKAKESLKGSSTFDVVYDYLLVDLCLFLLLHCNWNSLAIICCY